MCFARNELGCTREMETFCPFITQIRKILYGDIQSSGALATYPSSELEISKWCADVVIQDLSF